MSKLEEREARRKSVVAELIGPGRGGEREVKKRVSVMVRPGLYRDVQRIAYVQRRSVSEVMGELMEDYRERNAGALEEYARLKD